MKKVLVVDDSHTARLQLENIINKTGDLVCVGKAEDGFEAIRMNHAEAPDIICMDINMPGMDGLTALRTLKALDPDVKVIIVSSLGAAGDRFEEAIRLGASRTVTKPYTPEEIVQIIRGL